MMFQCTSMTDDDESVRGVVRDAFTRACSGASTAYLKVRKAKLELKRCFPDDGVKFAGVKIVGDAVAIYRVSAPPIAFHVTGDGVVFDVEGDIDVDAETKPPETHLWIREIVAGKTGDFTVREVAKEMSFAASDDVVRDVISKMDDVEVVTPSQRRGRPTVYRRRR